MPASQNSMIPTPSAPTRPPEHDESRPYQRMSSSNRFERLTPRQQRWLCFAFAAVLLLLGELGARGWNAFRTAAGTLSNPALFRATIVDQRLLNEQDGSRFIRFDPYQAYRMVPYNGRSVTINSLGLRGAEVMQPKPPGVFRVIVTGGSTTFGFGASSDSATIPAYLEQILRQQTGLKVEVINAGVPGYDSAQELVQLELRLLQLQPDMVIVYDGANDLFDATLPDWAPNRTLYTGRLERQVRFAFTERGETAWSSFANASLRLMGDLLSRSALITKVGKLAAVAAGRGQLFGEPVEEYRYNAGGIQLWVQNVSNIVALARAHNAQVLVAMSPVIGVVNKPLSRKEQVIALLDQQTGNLMPVRNAMFDQAARVMARVGANQRFEFLNLNQQMQDYSPTLFFDSYHLLDDGNRAVAEQIALRIRDARLLPSS